MSGCGYVFVSNSNKPTEEQQNSCSRIELTNVSRPCLQTALEMGYMVFLGTNRANPEGLECELPVQLFDSHTYRRLTDFKSNLIAYKNMCKIIKQKNVTAIHCNTPIGGIIGRLCGKKYNVDKVIYTAHGFHFYQGAPLFNRTVLKWAEQIMAHWTDAIITINEEDYQAANTFKFKKNGKAYYVPGVGINTKEYSIVEVDEKAKRQGLGLSSNNIVLISMGDLVPRKNYKTAIEAVARAKNSKLHYLVCGNGPELKNLKALAESLKISHQIHFLGFRSDVKELLRVADMFLFTTLQEGLPRSMMEAMASGLPCIASKIRGNVDLIEENINGCLCAPTDADAFAEAINKLVNNAELCNKMKDSNLEKIHKYDISFVEKELKNIYQQVLA